MDDELPRFLGGQLGQARSRISKTESNKMNDLTLERKFAHTPDVVFAHVTQQAHLKEWMGPVTMRCIDIDMNLPAGAR